MIVTFLQFLLVVVLIFAAVYALIWVVQYFSDNKIPDKVVVALWIIAIILVLIYAVTKFAPAWAVVSTHIPIG